MNNYALSALQRKAAVQVEKKNGFRKRDVERGEMCVQIEINRHWLREAVEHPQFFKEEEEEKEEKEKQGRRNQTPMDTGRISRINGPRRSTKEIRCRAPLIAVRLADH